MKETAFDCTLNAADNEDISCYSVPKGYNVLDYSFTPELQVTKKIVLTKKKQPQTKKVTWKPKIIQTADKKKYVLNPTLLQSKPLPDKIPLYSWDSFQLHLKRGNNLIPVGELVLRPKKDIRIF